jgi:hypothetical protein
VLPKESRIQRLNRRARRRTDLTALEVLEERTLLSFSNLGFSLPDLKVSGEAGPRAAWGGTIVVSAYLQNIGASTTTEPMSQAGATNTTATGSLYSSASASNAPNSTVNVLISPTSKSLKGAISIGTISAPPLEQNSVEQLSSPFTLPSQPAGFAGAGGKFFVWFMANSNNAFPEANTGNNLSKPVAVQVTGQPLPELRAIGLAVPSRMQPGDTINPVVVVENFGTADTSAQGPVTVDLVESVTKNFTLGSQIVATYTINVLPGVSGTPTKGNFRKFAKQILAQPSNVVSLSGTKVTLSTTPSTYFLGVVIDPQGAIKQLSLPKNSFQVIHVVGPPIKGLPPANTVSNGTSAPFPTAPFGGTVGNV